MIQSTCSLASTPARYGKLFSEKYALMANSTLVVFDAFKKYLKTPKDLP
jgi:hypothetical protein